MTAAPTAQVRLPDWNRLSPTVIGLVAWSALAAASLALTLAFGWGEGTPLELRFWRDARGWFDVVLSALFGWTVGGGVALLRGARGDLEALRPALGPDAPLPECDTLPRRALWGAAAWGIALGVGINAVPAQWPDGFPGLTHPFFLWATLRTILVVYAICLTGVIAASLARRFSRLGHEIRVDDLLDLRPLAPLGRCGLRSVAVWVGISAILAIMLIAPFGRSVNAWAIAVSAVIGVIAFLGPVRGARRRLVEARDAELARVRAALRARLYAERVPDARLDELSLADLLAWEERVERVRTLPFDTSTVVRFGVYVAIGLGSWVGAALVERALGAALG